MFLQSGLQKSHSQKFIRSLKYSGVWFQRPLKKIEKPVALPQRRKRLQRDISRCEFLGSTPDGMQIFLSQLPNNSALMREIGRLRELSFRAVGEGTGKLRDLDEFDAYYLHLVLWNPAKNEIAGSYRMADSHWVMETRGAEHLYSSTLFEYSAAMEPFLKEGLELGRSFVQPKYQGTRSLDYLWYGIGAFLSKYPRYRYCFGPVSISNALAEPLKDMLVYFYSTYFPSKKLTVRSFRPYRLDAATESRMQSLFNGDDYSADFIRLKAEFANYGASVPTLYKQYCQLAEPGGVQFLDFGIDPDFANCIDGLVILDIEKLKSKKRQRYLSCHNSQSQAV